MIYLLFIAGLFIGSFLNVVIDRLPRGEGIIFGHSHCDFCQHELSPLDLIPLLSFIFLQGRCRYCKRFLGWKYPIIELTTGIAFALVVLFSFTSPLLLPLLLGIVSCLIIIFYTDLFSGIIPDSVLVVLFFLSLVRLFVVHASALNAVVTAIATGLFFLSIFLITKGKGIGFGDVKYGFVMGMLLGFPYIIPGLYLTFLTGAGIALILIVARKKRFHQTIPLGPFLVFGTIINVFLGSILWQLFLHILEI